MIIYREFDIRCHISEKVCALLRLNVGHFSFQSDIGSSNIRLSLILLITDIGQSAHICMQNRKQLIILNRTQLILLNTRAADHTRQETADHTKQGTADHTKQNDPA
jgi:hypothetical protein